MTPLAAYLTKQIVARPKHREHIWREPKNLANLRESMHDIHCFEVTGCLPLLAELAGSTLGRSKERAVEITEPMFERYAFLPAPKTWLEWMHGSGSRVAVLLEEREGASASATLFCHLMATNLGTISTNSGDHYDFGGYRAFPRFISDVGGEKTAAAMLAASHMLLVLVNSPRIIGRRQHMPNAALERKLTRGFKGTSFPLRAWTEILLRVNKPTEIDDGEPHEAHLTGQRALHFVRKHIRIRNGCLEYVSAHWRGDPSLGIKQSRYKVVA